MVKSLDSCANSRAFNLGGGGGGSFQFNLVLDFTCSHKFIRPTKDIINVLSSPHNATK